MAQRIIALYPNFEDARGAVEALVDHGFARNSVSLIASDRDDRYRQYLSQFEGDVKTPQTSESTEDVTGGQGAGFGAVVGTLVGLGVALIPGIGPVLAAGPLAAALMAGIGAASGAVTGGLVASLIDTGMSEDDARDYGESLKRGGAMVALDVSDADAERAQGVLYSHEPTNVHTFDAYGSASTTSGSGTVISESPGNTNLNTVTTTSMSTPSDPAESTQRMGQTLRPIDEPESSGVMPASSTNAMGQQYEDKTHEEDTKPTRVAAMNAPGETVREYEAPALDDTMRGSSYRDGGEGWTADQSPSMNDDNWTFERAEDTRVQPVRDIQREGGAPMNMDAGGAGDDTLYNRTPDELYSGQTTPERGPEIDMDTTGIDATIARGYGRYSEDFRADYVNRYGTSKYSFDQFTPAYHYGFTLANDPRYRTYTWSDLEPEARRYWESEHRHDGPWDDFKDAVRHAWMAVTGRS